MAYEGVKFGDVIFVKKEPPFDGRINTLVKWYRLFSRHKLAPCISGTSYGNLSFRLKQENQSFIITGAQLGLEKEVTNDCFVLVHSLDEKKWTPRVSGTRPPSSESGLHHLIYRNRSDINAIFHGHCQIILEAAEELGIPITIKEEQYGTPELSQRVLETLGKTHKFIIMKNHGFLSLGGTMEEAGRLAKKVFRDAKKVQALKPASARYSMQAVSE
jgi:ribulose-5-phosphate 4-epimerase/fuculose-1-phosphate aldolase